MGRGLLAKPIENNKVRPEDLAYHNWFRFVLSFPPHMVRDYLSRFGVTRKQVVLDPFCGTGTTLVECKRLGIPSIGIEANPPALFATNVKVNWDVDADELLAHSRRIANRARKMLIEDGIQDCDLDNADANSCNGYARLRALPEASQKLLLKDSISPLPLHKTLVLKECISKYSDERFCAHQRLALAKALVLDISNLHFGPEVGVRRDKKRDADAVSLWMQRIREIAVDLTNVNGTSDTPSRAILGDSRDVSVLLPPSSVDVVITSPPYPNEKDYTRTTRLESVLLDFVHDNRDLRGFKKTLVRSNTRSVYKEDTDDQLVADNREIRRIARDIERRRVELGKTSGFERLYARVTQLYFGGMARHLTNLRPVLRPGAKLAYVVGDQASYLRVMIHTGAILADIAESLGYRVVGRDLFRMRRATATKQELREEVLLLEWPGRNVKRRASREKAE
jgi:DNA modification methylase